MPGTWSGGEGLVSGGEAAIPAGADVHCKESDAAAQSDEAERRDARRCVG